MVQQEFIVLRCDECDVLYNFYIMPPAMFDFIVDGQGSFNCPECGCRIDARKFESVGDMLVEELNG